jgi:8-oxo-dGTP diphosphatase
MAKYTYDYPKADITVDIAVFGISDYNELLILMIKRGEDPYQGRWALPGGFIEFLHGETAEQAARRELEEEAGLKVAHLEQLMTFDQPNRDPRGRTFSVAHLALVRAADHTPYAGSDASAVQWVRVTDALAMKSEIIAFDHQDIIRVAVHRLLAKVHYTPIGLGLLPEEFTISQLQRLYEALLQEGLEKSNFRKKIRELNKRIGFLEEVGIEKGGRKGPEAKLYRFNEAAYNLAAERGINFEI